MRLIALSAMCLLTSSVYGDGILKRYGADGSLSQRFGGAEASQEIVIIDGRPYRVQRGPSSGPAPRYGIDPRTGAVYPDVGSGAINPNTGQFYPRVGGGFIDPATGRFIPGN